MTATFDLSNLDIADGFTINGGSWFDYAGWSVAGAGDVNGDGIGDILVGEVLGDTGGDASGTTYVVFGGLGERSDIDLSNLPSDQGFSIFGDVRLDLSGISVSSAGDFNGDGIDDLIIGAPGSLATATHAGKAYVVFGASTGLADIDLAHITSDQGFSIIGEVIGNETGYSVSSAGDLNGDGFDDVIIGAPGDNVGGENAGKAYVVFGSASGPGDVDLANLTPEMGFTLNGIDIRDGTSNPGSDVEVGASVAAAGDLNGDGIDDLVVGAPGADPVYTDSGAVYVIFGRTTGFSDIDLAGGNVTGGVAIFSERSGSISDHVGYLVASAGDVNGDGIDDLLIGAPHGEYESDIGNLYDVTYVIYGGTDLGSIELTDLDRDQGFVIGNEHTFSDVGWSAASAGDVNGDGFDDIIVGARGDDAAGTDAGAAYVIYGRYGERENLNLSNMTMRDGFSVLGAAESNETGFSVSAAGDVNNDGFSDLLIGAPSADGTGTSAGEAYVIYGKQANFSTVYLSGLSYDQGFVIDSSDPDGNTVLGFSVASAGDVNGDGFDDVIVGEFGEDAGDDGSGAAYVIFGGGGDIAEIQLSSLSPESGFALYGGANNVFIGYSVASAGDLNDDGIDDLVIGAPGSNNSGSGEAFVVFGRTDGFADLDLTQMAPEDGFHIQGGFIYGGEAGYSVSTAGDINADGIDDLIIGDPSFAALDRDGGGAVYVIYGKTTGYSDIDLAALSASDGFRIDSDEYGDGTGNVVSNAGDVNNDGIDDLIIGASRRTDISSLDGKAYVVFGRADGFSNIDLGTLTSDQGVVISGGVGFEVGASVSDGGDVNGDGIDDLIVSAPSETRRADDYGAVYVIMGDENLSDIDLTDLSASQGFRISGTPQLGRLGAGGAIDITSAGDVNGDGFDDILIGAYGNDENWVNAGAAYVVYGSAAFTDVDLYTLDKSQGFVVFGEQSSDGFGRSLSSAGDMNGDGIDDLIGGATGNGGAAYVIYGARPTEAVTRIGSDIGQSIFGGEFDDVLYGLGGDDILDAGAGDDLLVGGLGADKLDGGDGIDTASYADASGTVQISLISGRGQFGEAGGDSLTNIENLIGSDFLDRLNGNKSTNVLQGGGGNDRLRGGEGDDVLEGEDGNDIIRGDDGDDRIFGDAGSDTIVAGAGDDFVHGGAGSDKIKGNSGTNQIVGGEGRDRMFGGTGSDVFVFETALDTAAGSLRDQVNGFDVSADYLDLSALSDAGLVFNGTSGFIGSGVGSVWTLEVGVSTIVKIDTDGDAVVDNEVGVFGANDLTVDNFLL